MIYLECLVDYVPANIEGHINPLTATIEVDPSAITAILHPTAYTATRVYLGSYSFKVTNSPQDIQAKIQAALAAMGVGRTVGQ